MNRLCTTRAVAVLVAVTGFAPVVAAPPTVTPSPGYDARLQEQRKALSATSSTVYQPKSLASPVPQHHARRKR